MPLSLFFLASQHYVVNEPKRFRHLAHSPHVSTPEKTAIWFHRRHVAPHYLKLTPLR
jgi:hypothetical protein